MAGIRVSHPTLAGLTYVVETTARFPTPKACPRCKRYHTYKSLHIGLGSDGTAIISPEAWEVLKTIPTNAGLSYVNEVPNPPPLNIGAVETPKTETVQQTLDGFNPFFWVPGISKQVSEAKMLKPFQPFIDKALEHTSKLEWAKTRLRKRLFVPR